MLFSIIFILSLAFGFVLPWYVALIVSFASAYLIAKSPGHAFLSGFAGLFLSWLVLALLKSIPNDNLLATRVAHVFHLPNWIVLLLVTAIIGGLVSGMAALSGILLRKAVKN